MFSPPPNLMANEPHYRCPAHTHAMLAHASDTAEMHYFLVPICSSVRTGGSTASSVNPNAFRPVCVHVSAYVCMCVDRHLWMPFCRCLCTGTRTDSHVCSHVLLCLFTGRCLCVCAGVSPARFTKLFEMLGEHRHLLKIKDLKHFEERI